MKETKIDKVLIMMAIVCFISVKLIQENIDLAPVKRSKQESAINVDVLVLKFLSQPFRMMTADFYWMMTLIESDLEHYKGKDLNNWLYIRFINFFALDPDFKKAYQFASLYLDIVKDDLLGADQIYSRAHRKFPKDYEIHLHGGFFYTFEFDQIDKGFLYYQTIIEHYPLRTPNHVRSIVNKIKFKKNNLNDEDIFRSMYQMYQNTKTESFRKKFEKDLYAIKARIDLRCLNETKKPVGCSKQDFFGAPYRFENGTYYKNKNYEFELNEIRHKER